MVKQGKYSGPICAVTPQVVDSQPPNSIVASYNISATAQEHLTEAAISILAEYVLHLASINQATVVLNVIRTPPCTE